MSIRKLASVLLLIPILTLGSSFIVVGTQDLEDTPNSLFNKTLMRWGSRSQPPLITSNSEGDIIVVGATVNADLQMVDSWQKTSKGGLETFILKLNAMGELVWSTYFGGSKSDYVKALETGSDGSIVIAGHTSSADLILGTGQRLTTADLFDFDEDLFVSRIEKNGTISSTAVFGGNLSEIIMSVTIDQDLNAVVFGQSYSPDFPSGQNSTLGAGFFLTKVGRDGSILEISKPSAFDDMYLFSSAYLNDHELVTVGSANFEEVLLTVIHINGTSLWSNSVSHGSDSLNVDSVFIDDGQRIVIVGSIYNESSQTAYNDYEGSYFYPDADEFIECFSSNGTRLWRNAIAGSSEDYGNFVIAGPSGEILLFGETYSSDFPNSWSNLSVYHGEGDISIGFHGPDGFYLGGHSIGGKGWERAYGGVYDEQEQVYLILASSTSSNGAGNLFLLALNQYGEPTEMINYSPRIDPMSEFIKLLLLVILGLVLLFGVTAFRVFISQDRSQNYTMAPKRRKSDLKSAQREVEDSTICKWDKGLLIPYTNKTTGKREFSVTRNADISLNNAAAMRIIPYEAIPTIKTEALKRFSESIDLHEVKFSALECTFCHRITAKEVGPRIPSSLEKRSADIAYEILDSSGSRGNLFRNPLPPVRKTVSYLKLFLLFRQSHYSKIVNDPDTSRIVTVVLLTSAFVNSLSSDIATLNGLAIFIWNFLSLCALLWIFTIVVYRFNIASAKDVSHDVIFRIIGLSHAFNIPLYFLVVLGTLMGFINSSLGGIFLPGMSIYFFEGFIFVHVLSTLLRDQLTKSPSWSFIWVSILLIVLQGLIFMLFGAVLVLSLFVWVF